MDDARLWLYTKIQWSLFQFLWINEGSEWYLDDSCIFLQTTRTFFPRSVFWATTPKITLTDVFWGYPRWYPTRGFFSAKISSLRIMSFFWWASNQILRVFAGFSLHLIFRVHLAIYPPWNQQPKPLKINGWFRLFISFGSSAYFHGRSVSFGEAI